MARKPIEGTVAENTLQYGVGGINIDATRVGSEMVATHANVNSKTGDGGIYGKFGHAVNSEPREGRWPANVILECTCENPKVVSDKYDIRTYNDYNQPRGNYKKNSTSPY